MEFWLITEYISFGNKMLSYILFCVYIWMQYPRNLLNNMTCKASASELATEG